MSLEALNRAWKSQQPGTKKLVLLAIANVADEWGYAVTGGDYLAEVCNVDLRSIRRHIKALVEAGELRKYKRGGGRNEANVYQVIIGLAPEEVALSETRSKIALEGLSGNGDKMSLFSAQNGDKMSPHTLNTAADIFNSRRAAAVLGDKMSPFPKWVDKFVRQLKNGDKMSLFLKTLGDLPEEVYETVETALESWHGSLEELLQLLQGAQFEHSYGLQEAIDDARGVGWRGGLDDVVKAWLEDPDHVENLIWYARQKDWGGGLLRRALQSGEWPPELKPDSRAALEAERARYLNDPYRAFYENMEDADV